MNQCTCNVTPSEQGFKTLSIFSQLSKLRSNPAEAYRTFLSVKHFRAVTRTSCIERKYTKTQNQTTICKKIYPPPPLIIRNFTIYKIIINKFRTESVFTQTMVDIRFYLKLLVLMSTFCFSFNHSNRFCAIYIVLFYDLILHQFLFYCLQTIQAQKNLFSLFNDI